MSKPTLYTFGGSVWAAAAELAAAELLPADGVEQKVLNLLKGENFDPNFIKVNPNATLPTLESNGKTYTSTADVVKQLIVLSGKDVKAGSSLIERLHAESLDPNFALLLSRNDDEAAAKGAAIVKAFLSGRQEALERFSKPPGGAPYKSFYDAKIATNGALLALYTNQAPAEAKSAFYTQSSAHYERIGKFIHDELPKYLPESEFVGGSSPGEDDFHLGAWITRIAAVAGAKKGEEGIAALEKTYGKALPQKVASYWNAWVGKDSFKTVYAAGLH